MKKHNAAITKVAPGWTRLEDEYGRAQYLPAKQPRRAPILGEVLPVQHEPSALMHAWQMPVEGVSEQTSAVDRAKGVTLRSMPMFFTVALLSFAGALVAWGVAGQVPAVLTFLVVMALGGGALYHWESRMEYKHSRGGVEIVRIESAADLEMARLENEAHLREKALDSYIRIMEQRYNDD